MFFAHSYVPTADQPSTTPYSEYLSSGSNTESITTPVAATTPEPDKTLLSAASPWEGIHAGTIAIITISILVPAILLLALGCVWKQYRRQKQGLICQDADDLHLSIGTNIFDAKPGIIDSSEHSPASPDLSKPPVILPQGHPTKPHSDNSKRLQGAAEHAADGSLVSQCNSGSQAALETYRSGNHETIFTGTPKEDDLEELGAGKVSASGQIIDASLVFESSCGSGALQTFRPGKPASVFTVNSESAVGDSSLVFESTCGSGVFVEQVTALRPQEVFAVYHKHYDSKSSRSTLLLWELRKQPRK